jgi:type II secretory pathway pseudopilin PulG
VLITLVVIGVIAAITVPTLMANYKKQEASAKIKKFYSTMQQVVTKAKADGNDWEDWVESASPVSDNSGEIAKNFVNKYILPYIIYTNTNIATNTSGKDMYIYLNDGMYFYVYKGNCINMVVDINGNKKPNVQGRDKFHFLYCPKSVTNHISGKITAYQYNEVKTREQAKTKCQEMGDYCSYLLYLDSWEFKSDYPYKI